jgi:hypothetical protein
MRGCGWISLPGKKPGGSPYKSNKMRVPWRQAPWAPVLTCLLSVKSPGNASHHQVSAAPRMEGASRAIHQEHTWSAQGRQPAGRGVRMAGRVGPQGTELLRQDLGPPGISIQRVYIIHQCRRAGRPGGAGLLPCRVCLCLEMGCLGLQAWV